MKRFFFLLLLSAAIGCQKNEAPDDTVAPVVLLTAPANNQVFNPGQTITVTSTISDNRNLREVHLDIVNTANGAVLTHDHYTPNGTSYSLSKSFTAQGGATYRIKVEADDEAGNTGRSEVRVGTN